MMDDDVLVTDGGEAVAAEVSDALREARAVGREEQVRTLVGDQLLGVGKAEQAVELEDIVLGRVELVDHEAAQILVHVVVDGQPDYVAAAATLQRRLEDPHQILGLLLDLHVAVAQHPEDADLVDFQPGEQPVQVHPDDLLHAAVADPLARQADETVDLRRQRDQAVEVLLLLRPVELQHHRKTEIGDEGKGVQRIDGDRRQDRKDLLDEVGLGPGAVGLAQLLDREHRDLFFAQLLAQLPPAVLLIGHQPGGVLVDRLELLGRSHAVLARSHHAGAELTLQPGDPHHVELVEVA